MCYGNKELDGDQKARGQWLGLYWDYVGVAGRLWGGDASLRFSGTDKEYKLRRNHNKYHFSGAEAKKEMFCQNQMMKPQSFTYFG